MTYDLYVDILFLVNFLMDYLLLAVLGRLLRISAPPLRMILSSGIGALWAVFAAAFPILPIWLERFVTYAVISSLMVKLAYRVRGVRETVKAVLGLYLSAATLGGTMYLLYEHTRAGYYVDRLIRGDMAGAMPVSIFLLLTAGTYFGTKYLWFAVLETRKRKRNLYRVILYYHGRTEVVTALWDTGNHLYEPVSRRPVHVIAYDACRQLCAGVSSVIYIPFQTVGTEKGLMPGVFLDAMEVEKDGGLTRVEKPLVGITRQKLSPGGEYQMLLNDEL